MANQLVSLVSATTNQVSFPDPRNTAVTLTISKTGTVFSVTDASSIVASAAARGIALTSVATTTGTATAVQQPNTQGLVGAPLNYPGQRVPSNFGTAWLNALLRMRSGGANAVITVAGESVEFGLYSSNPQTTSWVGLLAAGLQNLYGDGGSGFVSAQWATQTIPNYTSTLLPNLVPVLTGSWSNYSPTTAQDPTVGTAATPKWRTGTLSTPAGTNDGLGVLVQNTAANGVGSALAGTYTQKVRGRYVSIFHGIGTSANYGASAYSIDSGAVTGTLPTQTALAVNRLVIDMGDGNTGWHTVTVTAVAGTTTGLFGFAGENPAGSGVIVNNVARSGFASGSYINFSQIFTNGYPATWAGGSNYPADLVIMGTGANDVLCSASGSLLTPATQSALVSPEMFESNLQAYFSTIKNTITAGSPSNIDAVVLMKHIGQAESGIGYQWARYSAKASLIADTFGAALINFWAEAGNNWQNWNALGYWGNQSNPGPAGTDFIHMGDVGHAHVYSRLLQYLPQLMPI